MRLDEHLLSECFEHNFADVPIEDVLDTCFLLRVELVGLSQIVNEARLVNDFIALCLVELPCLLHKLFVQIDSREKAVIG